VSWKYGGGNPEGTAAEIKTSGEPVIETKGKQVKANASEDSPAAHVARDGNDVAKRESALTKKVDASENTDSEATSQEVDPNVKQSGQNSHEPGANKEEPTPPASDNNAAADVTEEPEKLEQHEDRMGVTPGAKKVEVGEKRGREAGDSGEAQNDGEQGERENGNAFKKTKLDNGDAAENGYAHTKDGNGVKAPAAEEEAPKKTKGSGRPKKADTEVKHAVVSNQRAAAAEGDSSTIARRTRSKA